MTEFATCDRYMHLRVLVSNDDELKYLYIKAAVAHNENMETNSYPDAGFDLFSPTESAFLGGWVEKLNFNIKCAATIVCENGKTYPTGYYLHPRSSTGSKTPLRLANSVGIIDSGYRGDIMAVFDCVKETYTVEKYGKLVQICAPGLVPIYVEIVDDLGEATLRGSGGFGSTTVNPN
jgi:dUTP pyrophosphatase